jgi:hypothetical protein
MTPVEDIRERGPGYKPICYLVRSMVNFSTLNFQTSHQKTHVGNCQISWQIVCLSQNEKRFAGGCILYFTLRVLNGKHIY